MKNVSTKTIENKSNKKTAIINKVATPVKGVYDYYVTTVSNNGLCDYISTDCLSFVTMAEAETFCNSFVNEIEVSKKELWNNIPNGAKVEFLASNNRTYQGVMVKGEFRTHAGSYQYVTNEYTGSYTINEVLNIRRVN